MTDAQRCCDAKAVGVLVTPGANEVTFCADHAPKGAELEPVKPAKAAKAEPK